MCQKFCILIKESITCNFEIVWYNKKNEKKLKPLTRDDIMKYEIADELGLLDKVDEKGWAGLTAKEAGRIGGILTSRKKQLKKKAEEEENKDESV